MSFAFFPFSCLRRQRHHHHHRHHHHSLSLASLLRTVTFIVGVALALFVCYSLSLFDIVSAGDARHELLADGVSISKAYGRHGRLDYDGIDVSRHQGLINWHRVGADSCVKFVYIKATEGSDLKDSFYLSNVRGAHDAGLLVGSYHYLTSSSSVKQQFRNFYSLVDRRQQNLPPLIDVEEEGIRGWSRSELRQNLLELIYLIERHYHVSPIIYCYARFYNDYLWPRFNRYRLFVSHYSAAELPLESGARPCLWQHSDRGIVDGIDGYVDLDVLASDVTLSDLLVKP